MKTDITGHGANKQVHKQHFTNTMLYHVKSVWLVWLTWVKSSEMAINKTEINQTEMSQSKMNQIKKSEVKKNQV